MNRIPPEPVQDSVWDYPRPPRVESCKKRVKDQFNGEAITDTTRAYRQTTWPTSVMARPRPCFANNFSRRGVASSVGTG